MRGILAWLGGTGLVAVACLALPMPSAAAGTPTVRPNSLSPGPAPSGATAIGAVPGGQQLQLSIVLPPSHGSQLQSLLQALDDPDSSEYHQWLRPGEFMQRFGPSPATVGEVQSWLHGVGLTNTSVSGFSVRVSALASTVASALGTSFRNYRTSSGYEGYVAQSAPLVPTNLASGEIDGVLGLNTVSAADSNSSLRPDLEGPLTPASEPHADGLTPCSAAENESSQGAYTLDAVGAHYGIGSLLAGGQNGAGETVGVFESGAHSGSDVSAYQTCFGLTNPVSTVSVDGGGAATGSDGTAEADVDIEQIATQAPQASIVSYEGPNTASGEYDTWSSMVTADTAQVISTSWGICEPSASSDHELPQFSSLFDQAAAQGQSIFAASGDSGSEDCYRSSSSTTEQVDYPASDPMVTAVGGTTLSGSGSESTWNSCQGNESTNCASSYGGQAAGGGGMSRYESRPSYQPNVLSWPSAQNCGTACREVPDISANAGFPMVAYVGGSWGGWTGTSLSAPFMAGLAADKNTGCTSRAGLWTTDLYALAAEGAYGSALTDVTSGNNDMTGSNNGAFQATAGYDPATGLGSPLAAGLSCPEVNSVSAGYAGSQVTVSGLGLEHATISFGGTAAQVVSASATSVTVTVPSGEGTVTVRAASVLGDGTHAALFTFGSAPSPAPAPTSVSSPGGYDLVGSDGGVFVFGSGFYGSLPGLGVHVADVEGIVPSSDDRGYFLVGSDGGVFSFGDTSFDGSLPGLGVHVSDIVGIVPTSDDRGYFLVGRDGGVFSFGDAPFENSLPGLGIHVSDIAGIAATADGHGYWLVGSDGSVYAFGDAHSQGNAPGGAVGITATHDGGGYWVVGRAGAVSAFGDAGSFGSLPALGVAVDNIVGIVVSPDSLGYDLLGSDGGVFSFGDAVNVGSLPGLGIHINNVVGAVPT